MMHPPPRPLVAACVGIHLEVPTRRAQEHVVQGRLRQRHLAHVEPGVLHERHEARDRPAAIGDVDNDGVVERADLLEAFEFLDAQHGARDRRAVVRVDVDGDDVGADRGLEVGRRALRDDAPGVDDRDLVGEAVGLLQVLRGEEERHALLAVELLDVAPQLRRG